MPCKSCGKELTDTPGKRKKQFCNSTCRSNYWHKQKVKEYTIDPKGFEFRVTTEGIIPIKKGMPKGLSLQEQIQWKINHP